MTFIEIIPRETWGNQYGTGWNPRPLPARHVILHHSETTAPPANATFEQDAAAVRYIDYIGWLRFNYADGGYKRPKGSGISYTWAVTPSGRVFQGHDINLTSSHTAGYNTSGVGIVMVGNYMNASPTDKQIDAVARLLLQAKEDGHIVNTKIDYGHKDVGSTDCPGTLGYPAIAKINQRVNELLTPPDPNQGYSVDWIKTVQTDLTTLSYYNGPINGSLPYVDAAVRQFQTDNNLTVDGLPGNQTVSVIAVRIRELADREETLTKIAAVRLSGGNRWATAEAVALAPLPAGKGVLLAADGTPDERYVTARAGGQVIYLPLRAQDDTPPAKTLSAIRTYQPEWVRVAGGPSVVTDNCVRTVLEEAKLL